MSQNHNNFIQFRRLVPNRYGKMINQSSYDTYDTNDGTNQVDSMNTCKRNNKFVSATNGYKIPNSIYSRNNVLHNGKVRYGYSTTEVIQRWIAVITRNSIGTRNNAKLLFIKWPIAETVRNA
jgi:hypothetical protein